MQQQQPISGVGVGVGIEVPLKQGGRGGYYGLQDYGCVPDWNL